jgi:hypothetical protein
LHTASTSSFFYSLPLFEFFIQNTVKNSSSSEALLSMFYEIAYSNAKLCYNLICSITNQNIKSLNYSTTAESENSIIIRPGMRKNAFDFIEKSVKGSSSKDIYIIDPYFSQKDVHFLKDIMDWCFGAKITVLTSPDATKEFSKYSFMNAWNELTSEDPKSIYFVSASTQEKKAPFHDRWILMYDKLEGLKLGSSINGIGEKRISEISRMLSTEVQSVYSNVIIPLVNQKASEYEQHLVKYETFEL